MSTPKGYSSQTKPDRVSPEFVTVSPAGDDKFALDVVDKSSVHVADTDAAEAGSTVNVVNATAHAALKGDRLRFTSGANETIERDVVAVDTDTITLGGDLPVAPSGGDVFDILRPTSITVDPDGGIAVSSTPVKFVLDGVDTEVEEDTVTPGNNRPLPVKLTGVTGDVNITANDLNVQLSHSAATPDSVQIGDGTEVMAINASNEAQVADDTARASLAVIEADTTSLDTKLPAQGAALTAASTPVNIASDQTVPISAASLPLPTGAATEATLGTVAGDTTSLDAKVPAQGAGLIAGSMPVNIASDQTVPVSAAALPLPTGAATEATLSAADTKLGTIDTSLNNIEISQDVNRSTRASEATLATLDGKVTAVDTGNVTIAASALPTGASTSALQSTGNTSLGNINTDTTGILADTTGILADTTAILADTAIISAWDTNAGAVGATTQRVHLTDESLAALENITVVQAGLDVVDLMDTPLLDASSSNIPGSASLPLQIVASLGSDIKKIQFNDTTGGNLGIYTGAASSEVLKAVMGPGSDSTIDVSISSGTRISIKSLEASAISVGTLSINFIG